MKVRVEGKQEDIIHARNLGIGQVGRRGSGSHVLRMYGGWVLLEDPSQTWLEDSAITFNVTPLPRGTKITLEVE